MDSPAFYAFAADAVLALHFLFVLFVVFGLVFIFTGKVLSWSWVRNPWFRLLHLLAIGTVVLQAWLGVACPLTIWEMQLRVLAGDTSYSGSFIAHWMETLLYYRAPAWVFTLIYTIFATIVAASWIWVRPRKFFH